MKIGQRCACLLKEGIGAEVIGHRKLARRAATADDADGVGDGTAGGVGPSNCRFGDGDALGDLSRNYVGEGRAAHKGERCLV